MMATRATPLDRALRAPAVRRVSIAWLRAAGWLALILVAVAIFGRIMTYPLSHDEQIHVVAGRLIFSEPLYRTVGYNHLPGLPLLLHAMLAITGSEHLLQTGRLLIAIGWVATAAILAAIGRYHTGSTRLAILLVLMFAAGEALGPAGMLVTNNLLPIPFALLGFHLFVRGVEEDRGGGMRLAAAGAAFGFAVTLKISYVFLVPPVVCAAVLVPGGLPWFTRLTRIALPLAGGAILGLAPALVVLVADPQLLLLRTVRYFTGPHLDYWRHAPELQAMTLAAKLAVAQHVWFDGATLLALAFVGFLSITLARQRADALRWWPIPLAGGLTVLGAILAFVPTPAFPQYYEPPVAFLIVLVPLLYRQLDASGRAAAMPVLMTVFILSTVLLAPRVAAALPASVRPERWTGNLIHAQGQEIRALVANTPTGPVATLAPVVALEGGLPIYREFGAGPFLYRVADYLTPSERRRSTTTSPARLAAFLDARAPVAIITGREQLLDPPFEAWALAHGYAAMNLGPDTRLFLRPARGPTGARHHPSIGRSLVAVDSHE